MCLDGNDAPAQAAPPASSERQRGGRGQGEGEISGAATAQDALLRRTRVAATGAIISPPAPTRLLRALTRVEKRQLDAAFFEGSV